MWNSCHYTELTTNSHQIAINSIYAMKLTAVGSLGKQPNHKPFRNGFRLVSGCQKTTQASICALDMKVQSSFAIEGIMNGLEARK